MRRTLAVLSFSLVVVSSGANGEERNSPRFEALQAETLGLGNPPPLAVTPPGYYALSIDGDFELGGFVFKHGYSFLHNDGGLYARNTALGIKAMDSLTPGDPTSTSGHYNVAVGSYALTSNTSGSFNTATGYSSLGGTTGDRNTATGAFAMFSNQGGGSNTAIGVSTMEFNTTGSRNVALGHTAGFQNSSGNDNIFINSQGVNPGAESNTLRIGEGTGSGNRQLATSFISGIHNAVLNGSNEHQVCVDDADQLGMCSPSSERFKSQVASMGSLSAALLDLRPVVFKYKPEIKREAEALEFGLVAEEVAQVFPQLVRYDDHGEPLTLRYDLLTPLLLNELQKQHRQNRVQWLLIAGMMLSGVVVATRRLG